MTLEEGIWMAIIINSISFILLFVAYHFAFKNHEEKIRKEKEDKQPKPWEI